MENSILPDEMVEETTKKLFLEGKYLDLHELSLVDTRFRDLIKFYLDSLKPLLTYLDKLQYGSHVPSNKTLRRAVENVSLYLLEHLANDVHRNTDDYEDDELVMEFESEFIHLNIPFIGCLDISNNTRDELEDYYAHKSLLELIDLCIHTWGTNRYLDVVKEHFESIKNESLRVRVHTDI